MLSYSCARPIAGGSAICLIHIFHPLLFVFIRRAKDSQGFLQLDVNAINVDHWWV